MASPRTHRARPHNRSYPLFLFPLPKPSHFFHIFLGLALIPYTELLLEMVYTLVCHLYTLPDATSISKVKNKLIEASRIYRNDRETLDWHVMQDVHDPRKFTIVERFAQESVRSPPSSHFSSAPPIDPLPSSRSICQSGVIVHFHSAF